MDVAVGEARPSVAVAAAESAVRERIGPRAMNLGARLGGADEIAFLLVGIAPLAIRIPVPGFDHEFGVLAVGDGLPSGIEDFLQQRIFEQMVGTACAQTINGGAERMHGTVCIGDVGGVGIDCNFLSCCRSRCPQHSTGYDCTQTESHETSPSR